MDELIEYLHGVAENANLPQYMRDRLTEAAAALEAAREDGERLDYVMRHVRGSELRRIGIRTNGGDHRPAIDQSRGKGAGDA